MRTALGLACLALMVPACSSSSADNPTVLAPTPAPETTAALAPTEVTSVVLVGDSLAQETAPNLAFLLDDLPVTFKFYGGTAPCDWLDDDLEIDAGSLVVITFTGNSATDCMSDGSGGHLRGDELVERYRLDVGTVVDTARAAGARVVLVGQPARGFDPLGAAEVDGLNAMYRALALAPSVGFVDAGARVENDDGSFALKLPCTSLDPECGADGTNAVRSDDGVHFCPGQHTQPCPVYSSGALRFALAIADAVTHVDRLDD